MKFTKDCDKNQENVNNQSQPYESRHENKDYDPIQTTSKTNS